MSESKTRSLFCAAAVGALASAASGALAQPASPPGDTTTQVEGVVVQARRKDEDIQTVPVAVSALNTQAIREAQIKTTTDVQYTVPGLYLTGSSNQNNPAYTVRGDGRVGQFVSSPFGVVLYFADVPLQANIGASVPPFDLRSIQVLKGPQGTLFGRNTTGGAILTYPNEPIHEFGGFVQAGVDSYDLIETQAVVNVPLIRDRVALRIGVRTQNADGYTENLAPGGSDLNDANNYTWRASLLVSPSDTISNLTIVDSYRSNVTGAGSGYLDVTGPNRGKVTPAGGGALGLATGDPFKVYRLPYKGLDGVNGGMINETYTHEYIKQFGVVNRTRVDLGAVRLTNIFGFRDSSFENYQPIAENARLAPLPGANLAFQAAQLWNYRQFTNEVQLAGSAFDDRVDWLLGGFWLKQEPSGTSVNDADVFFNAQAQYAFFHDTSKALFANVNVDLGQLLDGLRFSAGYRHTWDKQRVCSGIEPGAPARLLSIPLLEDNQCNATFLRSPTTSSVKGNEPTYTIGLDWQVNSDVFAYVVHRRSYKAGGSNVPAFTVPQMIALQTFEPTTTKDVEIGLKSDFAVADDVRFRLNVAAFRSIQSNIQNMIRPLQTNVFFPAGCVAPPGTPYDGNCLTTDDPFQAQLIVNGGKRAITGVELEGSLRFSDWLTLGANGSFMNVKPKKPTNFPANVNLPGIAPDIDQVLFFPESSYSANWRLKFPFVNEEIGELVYSGAVYHSGKVDDEGYPNIDPYTTVNMRLDWNNIAGRPVDLGFYVTNVFDIVAELNISNTLAAQMGNGMAIFVPPRRMGVELRYRFGADAN